MIHIDNVCKTLANSIRRLSIKYTNMILHPEVLTLGDTIDVQGGYMIIGYNAMDKLFKLRIDYSKGKSSTFEYDAESVAMLLDDIEEEMYNYFGVKRQSISMNTNDVKSLMRRG